MTIADTSFEQRQPLSARTLLVHRIIATPSLLIGIGVVGLIVFAAIFASWLSPHDPYIQNLSNRLIPPFWAGEPDWTHPLGTDQLGRDYLSRMLHGARISLTVGFGAAAVSCVIGVTLGLLAGYFGGRIDAIISLLITTRLSMPVMIVALAVASVVGGSLFIVTLVLGLLLWDRFAIVIRTATRQVCSLEFVAAAEALGCSKTRILLSEILPNVMNVLIVVGTLEVAHAILLEAALSFLGLGVQPPLPSWGLMVSEAKNYMFFNPWLINIPGLALFMLVVATNLLGDGLRDVTTPENRS